MLDLRSRSGLTAVLATRAGCDTTGTVALTLLATFTRLGPSIFLGSRLGFWEGGATATRWGIWEGSIAARAGRNRRAGPAAGCDESNESTLGSAVA